MFRGTASMSCSIVKVVLRRHLLLALLRLPCCLYQAIVKVVTIYRDNDEVGYAKPGENLRIRISGVEEEDISSGFVLSSVGEYSIYLRD